MVKQITIRENGKTMVVYDMGGTLQMVTPGATFNVNKNDFMRLLNLDNKTYHEIKNDGEVKKEGK